MSTVFDVVAVLCIAAFAWFVWPPLVLLVVAAAALAASWRAAR
jgi:hypothetical protein